MRTDYKVLGNYIRLVDKRNRDLSITNLLGVSIEKRFIPSIANIIGTDLSSYKVVQTGQFAYGPVTSRNGEKISIAYLDGDDCIISSSYTVFEVIDKNELDPEYLMLWFSRPEFDRYARYKSHGSVREIFDWDELCMVELPVPDIEEQRNVVKAYKTITDRIALKKQINDNLANELAAFYEVHCPKVSSGSDLPDGWSWGCLGDITSNIRNNVKIDDIPANSVYVGLEHIPRKALVLDSHGFIEDVSSDKLRASKGDVLFGKIRPYFHKVSVLPYDVYCSGDALVLNSINEEMYGFVVLTLFSTRCVDYAVQMSNGAKMPRAEWKELQNYKIPIPTAEIAQKFNHLVNKTLELIFTNTKEIIKLRELQNMISSQLSSR